MKRITKSIVLIFCLAMMVYAPLYTVIAEENTSGEYNYETLPGAEFNLVMSTVKVGIALVFTLLLLVGSAWLMKRFMQIRNVPGLTGSNIDVLEIRYLAPHKSIALIRVSGRVLIIGLTDQAMSTLGELSPQEAAGIVQPSESSQGSFSAILGKFTKKEK